MLSPQNTKSLFVKVGYDPLEHELTFPVPESLFVIRTVVGVLRVTAGTGRPPILGVSHHIYPGVEPTSFATQSVWHAHIEEESRPNGGGHYSPARRSKCHEAKHCCSRNEKLHEI